MSARGREQFHWSELTVKAFCSDVTPIGFLPRSTFPCTEDIVTKFGKVVWDPEFTSAKRRAYLTETGAMWLGYMEKFAPAVDTPEDKAFFASSRLTWLDFLMYNIVDYHIAFADYDLGDEKVNIMKDLPKLAAFHRRMSQRPRIAAYLASDRRAPFSIPYPPKKWAAQMNWRSQRLHAYFCCFFFASCL